MNKPLKKCGRRFLRTCDVNRDSQVVLSEWLECIRIPNMNVLGIVFVYSEFKNFSSPLNTKLMEMFINRLFSTTKFEKTRTKSVRYDIKRRSMIDSKKNTRKFASIEFSRTCLLNRS